MDPTTGLPRAQAWLGPVQQLAVMIQAIDLAVAVAAIDVFGRDLYRPGLADPGDVFLEIEVHVEHLDAAMVAVGDKDMAVPNRDAMRRAHLAVAAAIGAIG